MLGLVGMTIFVFLPTQKFIPFTQTAYPASSLSLESIVSSILPTHWLQVFSLPTLFPIILLAILLGISAQKTLPHNHVFIETVEGIRKIIMTILQAILPWSIIAVAILSIHRIGTFRTLEFPDNFYTITIFFNCYRRFYCYWLYFPLLFRILKVPVHLSSWLRKFIPSTTLAFSSGSVIAAGGLLLHAEVPHNPRRKIIDTIISLSFIFARSGVTLVIAVTYLLFYKAFSSTSITIVQFLLVLILSIALSYASEIVLMSIITVGIATLSRIEIISVQELYVIALPFIPVLMGFAATIDSLCFGFLQFYVKPHGNTKTSISLFYSRR